MYLLIRPSVPHDFLHYVEHVILQFLDMATLGWLDD